MPSHAKCNAGYSGYRWFIQPPTDVSMCLAAFETQVISPVSIKTHQTERLYRRRTGEYTRQESQSSGYPVCDCIQDVKREIESPGEKVYMYASVKHIWAGNKICGTDFDIKGAI